jgi:hypothetical protein
LELGLTDAVPISLAVKYTFEEGELDLELFRSSLEELLDGDYWPLRGVLSGLSIVVFDPSSVDYFEISDRPDLTLSDVRNDATLAHGLVHAYLTYGDAVLRIRIARLADGYLVGVNISHSYADAHTLFRLFWAAWAARYSNRPIPRKVLNDRSALMFPPAGAVPKLSPHVLIVPTATLPPPPKLPERPEKTPGGCRGIRELFHVSDKELQTLQNLAGSGTTRQQALCALVWKALRVPQLVFPCNVRENERRFSPVLPFEHPGNGLFVHGGFCDDPKAAPLSELARLIKQGIDECTAEANASMVAYLDEIRFIPGQFATVPLGEKCAAITSWQHFEICPLFGSARPRSLWTTPDFPRFLLVITDGEPDGLDVHGHLDEVAAIRTVFRDLLADSEK